LLAACPVLVFAAFFGFCLMCLRQFSVLRAG
jgi:hypothetical protein